MTTLLKEAFQNETLHDSTIRRWHRAFTNSRESTEIVHTGARLRTIVTDVNINTVPVVIEEDHHSSIWKLADDLHIPRMSIQRILTKELGMKRVDSMLIPHFLQAEEVKCCHSVHLENLWVQIFRTMLDPLPHFGGLPKWSSGFIIMILKWKVSQWHGSIRANPGWKRFVSKI